MALWLKGNKREDSDEALITSCSRGDTRALGVLFDRYVEPVYGVCLFYFREREQARDAVMQVFEKVQAQLRKSRITHFRAWICCIARNHCISELRKKRAGRLLPESYLEFELLEADPGEEQRLAGISDDELLARMADCLPRLKEKQRACVEAFYLQGKSYQEISEAQGYAVNEVKSYIQNGKRNLRIMITESVKNEKAG